MSANSVVVGCGPKLEIRLADASALPYWVVHSQPNSERRASDWLERFGIRSYLPLLAVDDQTPRPFFPRYLFAQVDPSVDPVSLRFLYGVSDVLRCNGGFAQLGDDVVTSLRDRETDGAIRINTPPPRPLLRGEQVRVVFGLQNDVVAKFLRMKGSDRAMVLVQMFGKHHTPIVHLHHIKRVTG